jgi:hypothetical protein
VCVRVRVSGVKMCSGLLQVQRDAVREVNPRLEDESKRLIAL